MDARYQSMAGPKRFGGSHYAGSAAAAKGKAAEPIGIHDDKGAMTWREGWRAGESSSPAHRAV
jgi:hypothetical protein